MGEILYSVARNEAGQQVQASDAEKSDRYFCGYCKEALILKKSGRTGRGRKRPHFAHKTLTPNCSPESALHFEFKRLLFDRITDCLKAGTALDLSWECVYCFQVHTGNLLKVARHAALERSLGECRPDIILFDGSNRAIAAIEVVVNHKPDEAARAYYVKCQIILIELHLVSEADLENLDNKLVNADHVQLCVNRKRCSVCGHFRQPVMLRIVETSCYKCNSKMRFPFIEGDHSRGSHTGPERFTTKELMLARDNGALIEWQYSRTLNTKYWAATCSRCRSFIGAHYLLTTVLDGTPVADVPLGYFCEYCNEEKHWEYLDDSVDG